MTSDDNIGLFDIKLFYVKVALMDQFLVKARYFDAGLSLIDYLRISLPPHPQPSK